jgi:hypothetical protein
MDLNISNVINISVSQTPSGVGAYNTSNLALFTNDPFESSFGDDGYKIYLGPAEVATDFGTDSDTYKMANALFSQQPNILANRGYLVVIPFEDNPYTTETLDEAITRTSDLVQYFGIMSASLVDETDGKAAAAVVQPLNKMLMLVSRTSADLDELGYFDDIKDSGFDQTRCLFYGADNDTDALLMMAAYAGRAFSTNFAGSNTTQTMHLKDLIGVVADPTMTQTLLNKAQAAGVDVYASIQGVAKVFTSGENGFFDDVYNLQWIAGALEVAGFNVLAQTSTKIPQTEGGMDTLKGAYRAVCEQGVTNQFLAPGSWNNPTTFGIQEDLFNNIEERGYYIYSQPVSQQLPTEREARQAPLIQIALKYAGAIHSSTVIVNINR